MNQGKAAAGRAGVLIYNSLIMCLAAVMMRSVGVVFGIYVSNRVGAEGMGLYSLITSVWGFALTLATSGINLASTRCVAEAADNGGEIKAAMRRAVLCAAGFGTLASLLLASLSAPIAEYWLKEARALLPLRCFAISLPAISVSSALSGYFTAVRRVWKSAAVQITEQLIKIGAVSSLLTLMLPRGAEYACVALVLGSALSEIVSCAVSGLLYCADRRHLNTQICPPAKKRKMTGKLLGIAMPVALSAYVRSGLTTVEHILIPVGLAAYGASRGEALASYGVLTGMVLPVVMFPYALIHSFTGLLVPELAGSATLGENKRITYMASRMFRLTIIFGLCVAGVMAVCSGELGGILYGNAEASRYILALAPLLPVMYLDTVTDSMLKGLGQQVYTMNVNIADAAISVVLVRLLLPSFGIYGYIAVLYISELLNFSLSLARLWRITGIKIRLLRWVAAPLLCVIAAANIACPLFGLFGMTGLPGWLRLTLHVITVIAVYLLFVRLCGALDRETCGWIIRSLRPAGHHAGHTAGHNNK